MSWASGYDLSSIPRLICPDVMYTMVYDLYCMSTVYTNVYDMKWNYYFVHKLHKKVFLFFLDQAETSAAYCMKTLRRQLEFQSYKPMEWALNCACLSQFFISRNMFAEGKHCLACAKFIMSDVQEDEGRQ